MKKQFNRMKQLANQTVGRQVLGAVYSLDAHSSKHTTFPFTDPCILMYPAISHCTSFFSFSLFTRLFFYKCGNEMQFKKRKLIKVMQTNAIKSVMDESLAFNS